MKAFETASQLNYNDALTNCNNMGFDIAQPYNEIESQTLAIILSNYTSGFSSRGYWIGKNIKYL